MGQRIIFEFYNQNWKSWNEILELFGEFGGDILSRSTEESSDETPILVRAVLPSKEDARKVIGHLRQTNGVGRVGLDSMHRAV